MKTKNLLLALAILFVSNCVYSQVSDNQKRLLLYYYSVDNDTKDKYSLIEAYLNNQDNLNKCQQCAKSAQMLYVALRIGDEIRLREVDAVLNSMMTASEINEFKTKYMSDFKLDLNVGKDIDNYKWDNIKLPEASKIKGSRDYYILSVNSGMDKKTIYETLSLLYKEEVDLVINAVKNSPESGEFMYSANAVTACYEYFYQQDCLEKLKDRMYDVKKYADNDMVFCKSQILKAIESEVQVNNNSSDGYSLEIYYYGNDNVHKIQNEMLKSDINENIFVGFDLKGDCNSIAEKELTFEFHKPDGSIFESKGKIPPYWGTDKMCHFSSSKLMGHPKYWVLGTWKIIVFADGAKIAEGTYKLKE